MWWTLTACFLLFDNDSEGQEPGDCSDAADNDGDGDFDCDDEGCFGSPVCEDPPSPPIPTGPTAPTPPIPTDPPDTGTEPIPTSDLDLSWRFPDKQGCEANNVDTIDVSLFLGPDLAPGFPVGVPCADGGALFVGLDAGEVGLLLEGVNAGNDSLFGGQAVVELFPGEQTSVEVLLTPN